MVLLLGCTSVSSSGISPVIARSPNPVLLGGQTVPVDLRIGFWGLCFGPAPVTCTPSIAALQTKREAQLAAEIPAAQGGGNFALAALALGLQASFVVLSGLPLFALLLASLVANLVQIYFNSAVRGGRARRERAAQAALWARSLDWAAAAGAVTSFTSYQAIVAAASRLIGTVAGVPLMVSVGGTASSLFAAVVGLTLAGALINTVLTAMDAGLDAYLAGKRLGGSGGSSGWAGMRGRGVMGAMDVEMERFQKRPAYERFP